MKRAATTPNKPKFKVFSPGDRGLVITQLQAI